MPISPPADVFGVDGIIILVVVVLVLFGSTQIPKLARSLGSAKGEFEKGLKDGAPDDADDRKKKKSEPKALEPGEENPSTQTRRDETTA